ncbi:aminotransferase class I/II-fold pyridoxal phosphate-dependent enzyme, partial [Methylobacterium sp. J-030]|uniref:aminotransferase class I/II-fold pyridoxal phosphate-dependent enzyme n=1 Tax=Methylobacterium sp. J-030 TaxID=2836627 RepID=UPI001FBABEFA
LETLAEARPASGLYARSPAAPLLTGRLGAAPPVHGNGGIGTAPRAPNLVGEHHQRLTFDFFPGRPNPSLFPTRAWRRHLVACLSGGAQELVRYGDPAGEFGLRAALCAHLAASRAIAADPNQVLILNGAQEGLSLCAHVLLRRGATALVESPSVQGAVFAFEAAGADVIAVLVDQDGLRTADLPDVVADIVHVTPAHQFPTGAVLSLERREVLAAWARRHESIVLENDCVGDLRYEGSPLPAVAALAPDCTIHVGSFSKTLGAGLRLGYMVVPPRLIPAFRAAKALLNNGTAWLEQAALGAFMAGGAYAAHLARLRASYRLSRDALLDALARHFGQVDVGGTSGGLHVLWRLPPGVPPTLTFETLARRARIGIYGLGSAGAWDTTDSPLSRRGVILGFGGTAPEQIAEGIARLSDVVDDRLDRHHAFVDDLLLPEAAGRPLAFGVSDRPAPSFRRGLALHPVRPRRPSLGRPSRKDPTRMAVVAGIYRYPVKGLSAEPLRGVELEAGRPFPFDRIFALTRPNVPVDVEAPKWAKKGLFLMLMLEEGLARARTALDLGTMRMTVEVDGDVQLTLPLDTPEGRARAEEIFGRLAGTGDVLPRLVRSRGGHFMDKPDNVLSLINLATVRDLERRWGTSLDPLRFRANFYVDGLEPWEEFDWVGHDVVVGDAVLTVDRRNGRCGATNVNPRTGQRDRDIPPALRASFGHKDLGVYLLAKTGGKVVLGDALSLSGAIEPRGSETTPRGPGESSSRFICRGCYFIYDEGEQASDAPRSETTFAALPANWVCPDCGTDKGKFRPYRDLAETSVA